MKKNLRGAELFELEYSKLYGERWPQLKEALLNPHPVKTAILSTDQDEKSAEAEAYYLDPFSRVIAKTLTEELRAQKRTGPLRLLDLCAAPGGKSLVLLNETPWTEGSELTCNEPSRPRRERLKSVLRQFGKQPPTLPTIRVEGKVGQLFGRLQPERFDAILVDAPCSSEAHVLKDQSELDRWSPQRPKRLSAQQFSLLESALHALAPGGILAYSTCSLHPSENEGVIQKIIRKYGKKHGHKSGDNTETNSSSPRSWVVELWEPTHPESHPDFSRGERLSLGWIFLPDRVQGGPLYWCGLKKSP